MRSATLTAILFFVTVSGAPSNYLTKRQAADDEAETGGDHNDHLFHGQHLWGLEDFHAPAESSDTRTKRQAADEEAETGGDHNDHLFHGQHLWGLEDFHAPAESS